MKTLEATYLVIGSGIAGLMSAHYLSRFGRVVVATKRSAQTSNSNWAQGGISCVVGEEDSFESHAEDTHGAGAGLCDPDVVKAVVEGGPAGIAELEKMGVRFGRREENEEEYDLGKEGGHTQRRVLHAGDITGHEVIKSILKTIRDNDNIVFLEHAMAIDLVTTSWMHADGRNACIGAYFLDQQTGEIFAIRSPVTVLATGGAGKAYLYTSNPDTATGDGIAMAWRAGLPIHNMEFVQFHPTCLFHPEAKSFLISEALRGEGGILVNSAGEDFTKNHDPRGSLAPRDIVARANDDEMKRRGDTSVFLDMRHLEEEFLRKRFPNIYATCLKYGIDMAHQPIPVVPAEHYCCGGVEAEVNGRTVLPGLYAVGEVTCTGLHGANRLASNSLLEGLVCARYLAELLESETPHREKGLEIPPWVLGAAVPSDEAVVVEHNWNEVRTCMWDYVGIVRTNKRLERAQRRLGNLRFEVQEYYNDYLVTGDVLELRNLVDVADLIVRSALLRKESRGLHSTLDYPDLLDTAEDTVIIDPPGAHAGNVA